MKPKLLTGDELVKRINRVDWIVTDYISCNALSDEHARMMIASMRNSELFFLFKGFRENFVEFLADDEEDKDVRFMRAFRMVIQQIKSRPGTPVDFTEETWEQINKKW